MTSAELYLRLLRHVRPHMRVLTVSLVAMVIMAATEPAIPALLKPLLDGSFVEKDPFYIRWMPVAMIGLFIVRGIASYASEYAMTWVANRVVMDLRNLLFAKLLTLPNHFFDNHPSGILLSKLLYDVNQVTTAATTAILILVRDSLAVLGLLAWMFYLNWKLALVFFIVVPAIGVLFKLVSGKLRTLSRSVQRSMGEMTHIVEESLAGNKVIKIFGGQEYEQARYFQSSNKVRSLRMKIANVAAANTPIVQLITACALALIVYFASLQSLDNKITVGGFVSFFGAMAMLFAPIKRLTSVNEHMQRGLAAAESIFGLLDEPGEPDSGTQPLGTVKGNVEFRDVVFRYEGSERNALDGVSFVVNAGETVAMVGASGSGKTTLANLLPRFYSPKAGQIFIDGIDIQNVPLAELRAQIAYVGQDVVLFNDTVAANIAYGRLDSATDEDIRRAAAAAYASEFIEKMPQGFDTLIGEDGLRLSGGQRQRLAIARAVLKNAPILILDEATSALDAESERQVQQALDALRKGRTTLVIAHRLSTIKHADRIVVMEHGRVKETGTHTELLAQGGTYAKLYQLQFAGQEGDT